MDILIDFVQDENHSILFSTHITSDLEKVADYITFIHKGKLIFSHPKDELIDNYGVVICGAAIFWDGCIGIGHAHYGAFFVP